MKRIIYIKYPFHYIVYLIVFSSFAIIKHKDNIKRILKGEEKKITPKRIYIDTEEKTIVLECNAQERFHVINSVEKVLDYGDWYHFVFKFEDRDPYFICQKNLLAQRSLAEFEALFAGKLEKRKL